MASKPPFAVYDACVLYPFHLRNTLIQCAFEGRPPGSECGQNPLIKRLVRHVSTTIRCSHPSRLSRLAGPATTVQEAKDAPGPKHSPRYIIAIRSLRTLAL